MKAVVTGASGFIGSAVVRRLLRAGYQVRALVRAESQSRNLDGLDIEVVTGDITRAETLEGLCVGCEALFHVAADYRLWVPDPGRMYRTNVEGTRNVMREALRSGVSRVVHTSSVATLGLREDGSPADETVSMEEAELTSHYKRTKFKAEKEVLRMVAEESLPAVIVNPATVVGPGDIYPTPTGRMIAMAASGRMAAYVDTGLNLVHVEDVAEGHLLACQEGRIGERYILGAQNMTLREILEAVAEMTGRRAPRVRLRQDLVLPVAHLAEAWARLTGTGEPLVTVDGVRLARKKMFFTAEKARGELGFQPRPAREALRDAVDWFRGQGYLQ